VSVVIVIDPDLAERGIEVYVDGDGAIDPGEDVAC
jgi:hypothetical protein